MRPPALLFDLDGTLVDSAAVIATVLNGMRAEQDQAAWPVASYRGWISLGAEQLVGNALGLHMDAVPAALAEFRRRYRALPTPPETMFPGVADTLAALAGQGYPMAVCSNKPEVLCIKVLQDLDLLHRFGSVVGGDSAASPKPHRAPLDHALAALSAAGKPAVLIGDSTVDQEAAAAAGIPFIFFTGGYDDGVVPGTPYASIDRLPELLALLPAMTS